MTNIPVVIEVLTSKERPAPEAVLSLAKAVAERLGPGVSVARADADTARSAPALRVNGRALPDPDAAPEQLPGSGADVPPEWLLEAAVLRELGPRGLLFLCVANSARSQIGEGVARLLAPADVRIQSAGSHPTGLRPEAARVLSELGIDPAAHWSKNVSEIDPETVDTVITLCGEEECPLFLGQARRLHWGLPDPAAIQGNEETRLDAFRQTRDELRRRIGVVFGG
jgi:arsenate reductase (thioredoxin)